MAGVLVENELDRPHRVEAARETTAAMAVIAHALVRAARTIAVGVEILLNDPEASLAAAVAAGAAFIRTDYFSDRMSRPDHGAMRIAPAELLAYRARLDAPGCARARRHPGQVRADDRAVQPRGVGGARARLAGADGIVVSGGRTGEAPTVGDLAGARAGAAEIPVFVGSGLDAANAAELLATADGAIVGTSLMQRRPRATRSRHGARRGPQRAHAREHRLRGRLRRRPLRRSGARAGRRHRPERRGARAPAVRTRRHRLRARAGRGRRRGRRGA